MQCAEMRPNKDKQYVDVLAHRRLDGQTIPIRFKAEDQPAQWMLGNANFATTMNIYAGLDNDKIRQSSSGLSATYAQICGKSCS